MENDSLLIKQVLEQVKQNKKYKSISDSIVLSEINSFLKSNPKITKPDKQIIKEIRARLHRMYSSYQTRKKKKREFYLHELQQNSDNLEITNKLLSLTLSTKERLEDYQGIYKKIFLITGKPKTLIDLGCGLNPLSFPLMNLNQLDYYAYDIDIQDMNFLNQYFKIMKTHRLNGRASILDIRDLNKIKSLPNSDIIFMFKLLDLINTKKTKVTEPLIRSLINKTKFLIISFATKTLTRKPMKLKTRTGFEEMLRKNNLDFQKFEISNEVFYIIWKD